MRLSRVHASTAVTHTAVILSHRESRSVWFRPRPPVRASQLFCQSISTRHSHDGLHVPAAEVMTSSWQLGKELLL